MKRVPFAALLVFLLASLMLLAGGRLAPHDEETLYRMTVNLVEYGQLTLTQQTFTVEPQAYPGFLPATQPRTQDTTWTGLGADGQRYPLYTHAQAVLQAPLYVLGRIIGGPPTTLTGVLMTRFCVSLLNPIVVALTGWLVAVFAAQWGLSRRLSAGLGVLYGWGTMAAAYTHTNFSDPLLALCFTLAAYGLYRAGSDDRLRWWGLAGAALGSAVYLRERALIAVPFCLIYAALARRPGARAWVACLLPLMLGMAAFGVWNWVRFGTLLAIGYADWVPGTGFETPIVVGVFGLLLSPGKGLLIYHPVAWLSVIGLIGVVRRRRAEGLLFGAITLASIVFYARYNFWTGGWNWGPRYLLPLLPLWLLAAGDWAQAGSTRRRGWLLILSALTLLINLSAVMVDQSRYLVGLGERDPEHYLERTILRVADSPLTRQWPIVLELADLYARPATWEAAQSAIDRHLQAYRGPAEFESISTHAMWVDEFFRLNAPDFWFVHLRLLGFSPLPIALVALGLLAIALIAGARLIGDLKAG